MDTGRAVVFGRTLDAKCFNLFCMSRSECCGADCIFFCPESCGGDRNFSVGNVVEKIAFLLTDVRVVIWKIRGVIFPISAPFLLKRYHWINYRLTSIKNEI